MDYVSLVASIVGILGLVGLAIGIYTFCLDRQKRAAEKDLGHACCGKEKMGYFAIEEPKWFKLGFWDKVNLPVVPKLAAIVEAGDDLAFTSSLFDSIPPNHNEACWQAI